MRDSTSSNSLVARADLRAPSNIVNFPDNSGYWDPVQDSDEYFKFELDGENHYINYGLLSHHAALMRDSVPRRTHVRDGITYEHAFTGQDIVSIVQKNLSQLQSLRHDRWAALLIATSLHNQGYFSELNTDEDKTSQFEDDADDIYTFSHSDNFEESLPTGVITSVTKCYAPMCEPGIPCYSLNCSAGTKFLYVANTSRHNDNNREEAEKITYPLSPTPFNDETIPISIQPPAYKPSSFIGDNPVSSFIQSLSTIYSWDYFVGQNSDEIMPFIAAVSSAFAALLVDKEEYQELLKLEGSAAQKVIDVMQVALDYPKLEPSLKSSLLLALLRLSKKTGLYPGCYTLRGINREEAPVAAGHFGEIWKGSYGDQWVCLKIVKIYESSQINRLLAAFSREAIVWRHVSHPNLLPFYGVYHLEDIHGRICLVSPWMENGNINDYLERNPDADRIVLLSDVIQGISHLHNNGITHGDLKGVNILVTSSGEACVADFGLSSLISDDVVKWTSIQTSAHSIGTTRWLAPELFDTDDDDIKGTKQSDIYAYSCVCYEVLRGQLPFYEVAREAAVMYKVMCGERPSRPPKESPSYSHWGLTDNLWKLMEECWRKDPIERPTAKEIIDRLPRERVEGRSKNYWDSFYSSNFRSLQRPKISQSDIQYVLSLIET